MSPSEISLLPFTADHLPENWSTIPDDEQDGVFLAMPTWLIEKLKKEEYISDKLMEQYRHECLDLQIDFHLKSKKNLN
jgi:hypothetical protein